ncbi:hypothetical protein K438DRAFT_916691 [Mycena galopus ATCC 62051]|nr:hypothetical protein K438DRAFT_916691 [Mycena galopus ATCC 62051]
MSDEGGLRSITRHWSSWNIPRTRLLRVIPCYVPLGGLCFHVAHGGRGDKIGLRSLAKNTRRRFGVGAAFLAHTMLRGDARVGRSIIRLFRCTPLTAPGVVSYVSRKATSSDFGTTLVIGLAKAGVFLARAMLLGFCRPFLFHLAATDAPCRNIEFRTGRFREAQKLIASGAPEAVPKLIQGAFAWAPDATRWDATRGLAEIAFGKLGMEHSLRGTCFLAFIGRSGSISQSRTMQMAPGSFPSHG